MAQTTGLSIGLLGGFNRSTFTGRGADSLGYSEKNGIVLGAMVQKDIGSYLFVRTGAILSTQGSQRTNPSPSQEIMVKLNYVKLPLIAGVAGPAFFGVKPHAFGGIENGLKAGCKFDIRTGSKFQKRDCNYTMISFSAKSFDLAYAMGAGLTSDLSETTFLAVDATWSRSRWKIGTDAKSPMLKNRAFSVHVGLSVRERRSAYR